MVGATHRGPNGYGNGYSYACVGTAHGNPAILGTMLYFFFFSMIARYHLMLFSNGTPPCAFGLPWGNALDREIALGCQLWLLRN